MATEIVNEITTLLARSSGNNNHTVIFLYPIATPETYVSNAGTVNFVPTPSENLPELAADILTAGEKTSLDAGESAFRVMSFNKAPGLTQAQLIIEVRRIYAAFLAQFNLDYSNIYDKSGLGISSV